MLGVRVRLVSLWIAQFACGIADGCLCLLAFLVIRAPEVRPWMEVWWPLALFCLGLFFLLVRISGWWSDSQEVSWTLVASRVLVGSFGIALVAAATFSEAGMGLAVLFLIALGPALYRPPGTVHLPTVARDAQVRLARVVSWMELGRVSALVGGLALGTWLLATPERENPTLRILGGVAVLSLYVWGPAVLALEANFVSRTSELFSDAGRILGERNTAGILLGLTCWQALTLTGAVLVLDQFWRPTQEVYQNGWILVKWAIGMVLGCWAAGLRAHPRRNLGVVPFAAVGLSLSLMWLAFALVGREISDGPPLVPGVLAGFMVGLGLVPLRTAYLARVPEHARNNAVAIANAAVVFLLVLLCGGLWLLDGAGWLPTLAVKVGVLAGLTAVGATLAWWRLLGPALEVALECVAAPIYRVRAVGPGAQVIPEHGPLLIIANHSSWLDPFWVGKVVPRRLIPMMTSRFYDLPIIRWFMVHVVQAIRVQDAHVRHEAPELNRAIEVLLAGGCVLLFPEGQLRRSEEQIIRYFRRGLWHILQAVPDTPVVVCWIEGSWGSFFSWFKGPPMKGKWFDWFCPIQVAIAEPQVVSEETLASHRATRRHFTRACLECRRYLGLEIPDTVGLFSVVEESEDNSKS